MTDKWTEGPWYVADWQHDSGTNLVTIEARSVDVVKFGQSSIWPDGIRKHKIASTEDGENPIADARLISAAPDLYAALDGLMNGTMEHQAAYEAARAALAKARGTT